MPGVRPAICRSTRGSICALSALCRMSGRRHEVPGVLLLAAPHITDGGPGACNPEARHEHKELPQVIASPSHYPHPAGSNLIHCGAIDYDPRFLVDTPVRCTDGDVGWVATTGRRYIHFVDICGVDCSCPVGELTALTGLAA